jgi:aminopeptidase-like protein
VANVRLQDGVEIDPGAAERMYGLMREAFGHYRSITGEGVRQTLALVSETIPLDVIEVPSGTPVLDWTVPQEWAVREAYVVAPSGERIFDVAEHNLRLVGYSVPFRGVVDLEELKQHLHSLPDRPDLIPHRTSYYVPAWGFCATQRELDALEPGDYEVVVDTELFDGALTYGELVVPGDDEREVLVITHTCHPSLANDNLSGIAVATEVARTLMSVSRRFTHRFLFIPTTIGAITWLATHRDVVERVHCGLVITGMGDSGEFVYKRSRRSDTVIDRVAEVVLAADEGARILDWYPSGYDERQFCSPGFDLAVGRLTRSLHGTFPEYHTSGDDLSFVDPEQLVGGATTVMRMLTAVDGNRTYRNLSPFGEPRLGPRGLFGGLGGGVERSAYEAAILWVLSLADGDHDLVSIAARSGLEMPAVIEAATRLVDADLLAPT